MADKPDRALAGKLLDFKAVERGSELLNGSIQNKRRIASLVTTGTLSHSDN
jgi:hypothetical protein